jgi:hypothetical protein
MILTAHQPVYIPWLGYFHKIALSDEFIIFDQVQYQKRDFNNRNKIKTQNSDVWLTVPVKGKKHFDVKVCDVEIDNEQAWAKKHWRTISLNYAKAPYFKKYSQELEEIYKKEWIRLEDLTNEMLYWFLEKLNIKTKVTLAGEYSFVGEKSDLVLNMCTTKNANLYIFGGEGKNYADRDAFESENISLHFQEYNHPSYSQLHGEFLSHLSILDLLFNHGDESLSILMSNNLSKNELERTIRE